MSDKPGLIQYLWEQYVNTLPGWLDREKMLSNHAAFLKYAADRLSGEESTVRLKDGTELRLNGDPPVAGKPAQPQPLQSNTPYLNAFLPKETPK